MYLFELGYFNDDIKIENMVLAIVEGKLKLKFIDIGTITNSLKARIYTKKYFNSPQRKIKN